jgi:hypothetical protein
MTAGDRHARRRGWAAVGTIVVHLLVLAWLVTRPPEPPPPEPLVLQDIELWDAADLPSGVDDPAPPRSSDDRSPPPPPDDPALDDTPPPVDDTLPRPRAPRAPGQPPDDAGGDAGRPAAADDAPPTDGETAVSPPGALAISGLRQHSRSGAITVQRPTLDPPTHSRNLHAVGSDAVFSPEPSDVKPSSVAEAGFKPRRRDGKLVYKHKKFRAILHADGRMTFSDLPSMKPSRTGPPQAGMPGPTGGRGPGLAEGLIAASGQELYVKEKRQLMEWTYELRLQMAIDFAERNIEKRLKSLYRELMSSWHKSGGTPEERREDIFERWDECEESFAPKLPELLADAPASIDDKRREAGRAARDTIEEFVRTHLPEGSTDGFTPGELRRFNARRKSRAKFDPYAKAD